MSTTLIFEIFGVDVNASDIFKKVGGASEDAGGKLGGFGGMLDGLTSKFTATSGPMSGMVSGWGMLIPVAIPLGSAVMNLSGVLGLVPAAMAFAGASALTLKLGFQGITEAIGLYNTAQDAADANTAQAAAQQISAANAVISADAAVKAARVSLADAVRNANNSMISADQAVGNAKQALTNAEQAAALNNVMALQTEQHAEESLTSAQNAAARAQQSLTDARESAKRSLEDAASHVTDSALAQRAAVEQLENAQKALSAPITNPNQAPKDMEALQLAVDQAQQQVAKMGVEYQRAQEDAQKAANQGIEGATQVVNAQDGVTSALASQRQAQTALGDAQAKVITTQQAGLLSVATANQRLDDATRAQQQAAISGAEQVTKANLAIDAALRAQQQTLAQNAAAADTAVGSLHAYNAALAEMSPAQADVVRQIVSFREEWQSLQQFVSQKMFAGVGDEIHTLGETYLPILKTGLGGIADGFHEAFISVGEWLGQKDTVAEFKQIFADFGVTAHNLAETVKPILQIFGDLVSVGASFLPGLTSGFGGAAQSVADFVRNAKDTGKLKEWIQTGLDTLQQVWGIAKDLILIFKDLMAGPGNDSGSSLLSDIKGILDVVLWLTDHVPHLGDIIMGVLALMTGGWLGLGVFVAFELVRLIIDHWQGVAGFFSWLWHGIGDIFWGTISWIVDKWNWLWDLVTGTPGRIGNKLSDMWSSLWNGFRYYVDLLIGGWNSLHFGIPSMDIFGVKIGGFDIGVPQIPFLAEGGLIGTGGLAVVGERGPEVVRLPTGAQVIPNSVGQQQPAAQIVNVRLEVVANDTQAGQFVMALVRNGVRAAGGVTAALGPVA